ncbi:MAG: hypothetical protein ACHQU8_08680 [Gemmatimonadales bacterium]
MVLVLSLLGGVSSALHAQGRATETGAAVGGIAGLLVGAVSAATAPRLDYPVCSPLGCQVRNMAFIAHADRMVLGAFVGAAAGALIGSRFHVAVGPRNALDVGASVPF